MPDVAIDGPTLDGALLDQAPPDSAASDADAAPDPSLLQILGDTEGWAEGIDVELDPQGNAVIAGEFGGTINIGPDTLSQSPPAPWTKGGDGLLAKTSAAGSWLWGKTTARGNPGTSFYHRLKINSVGESYYVGTIAGTVEIGNQQHSPAVSAGFLLKVDSSGTHLWHDVYDCGGITDADGVGIDGAGNAYVSGSFEKTLQIGGLAVTSKGGSDIYLLKVDPAGTPVWLIGAGGGKDDAGRAIAVAPNGSVYIGGLFTGQATFGSVTLTAVGTTAGSGATAAFVAEVSPAGVVNWVAQGGTSTAGGNVAATEAIAVHSDGTLRVGGLFEGQGTFGSTVLTGTPQVANSFVAALDGSGTFKWAVRLGKGVATDLWLDKTGVTYAVGALAGTAAFGSTANGGIDAFVARVAPGGQVLGGILGGGLVEDAAYGITGDGAGNLFVAGYVRGPGPVQFGTQKPVLDGTEHLFLWKLPNSWL